MYCFLWKEPLKQASRITRRAFGVYVVNSSINKSSERMNSESSTITFGSKAPSNQLIGKSPKRSLKRTFIESISFPFSLA